MFHDTIRANLRYAPPDATDAQIGQALAAAQIWRPGPHLPEGLETVVGDRGHRLSGGEKQRIAIARLLLKAPGIVVLDEATAHLDSESEAAVQRALDTALAGRTSLVIAHRLSTVRAADQILVVDDGRIVERGTHLELLAAGGLYADLYRHPVRRARQRRRGRRGRRHDARGARPLVVTGRPSRHAVTRNPPVRTRRTEAGIARRARGPLVGEGVVAAAG